MQRLQRLHFRRSRRAAHAQLEAALQLRAAVKFAPKRARAFVLLGAVLRDQDEYDEARTYLELAIDLEPSFAAAYFELGVLYNKRGENGEAGVDLPEEALQRPRAADHRLQLEARLI